MNSRDTPDVWPDQPGLVVIPGNGCSSRYSQRMTDQELKESKAILLRLSEDGAGRDIMIGEISRSLGRPISKSQVDKLRRELGLINHYTPKLAQPQQDAILNESPRVAQDQLRSEAAAITQYGHCNYEFCVAVAIGDSNPTSLLSIKCTGDAIAAIKIPPGAHSQDQPSVDCIDPSNTSQENNDMPPHTLISTNIRVGFRLKPSEEVLHLRLENIFLMTLGLQPYFPSDRAHKLYLSCSDSKEREGEGIARLNHAATILHILRAFGPAFDLHFLIYCHFKDIKTENEPPHPQFVLAAINCARSARTLSHAVVASYAVSSVREDLLSYYGAEILEHTRAWRCLEKFDVQLRNLTSDDFREDIEETAYWEATAMILSHRDLANKYEGVPDFFPTFLQRSVVEHLHECPVMRYSMLEAFGKVSVFIRHRKNHINKLATTCSGIHVAQTISCLLLYERLNLSRSPGSSTNPVEASNHDQFPCTWNGFIALTLPFVLVDWLEKAEAEGICLRVSKPIDLFVSASEKVWQSLHSDSSYKDFIDFYLRSMGAPEHRYAKLAPTVSEDWLFGIAAATANLDPGADDWEKSEPDFVLQDDEIASNELENGPSSAGMAADVLSLVESIASSYSSLASQSYESFLDLADRIRQRVSASLYTRQSDSSGAMTSRSSWSFSRITGFPRAPSTSQSNDNGSSDVAMSL